MHGDTALGDVHEFWNRSVRLLRQLFMPPDIRHAELEELASIGSPEETHVDRLLPLLAGPNHLHRFLSEVESVAWLEVLTDTGLLDPPSEGPWPVSAVAGRLSAEDGEAFSAWLASMYDRLADDPARLWYVGRVAVNAGGPSASVVVRLLHDHSSQAGIVDLGVWMAERLVAESELIEKIADVVLNQAGWQDATYADPVLERLVDGVTESNAADRMQLLCWKLSGVTADGGDRRWLMVDRSGSIAEWGDGDGHDRFTLLVRAFAKALRKSASWVSTDELLDLVDELPDDLRGRFRAWVLTNDPDPDLDLLIGEIERAIAERDPTGDDLALVDRIIARAEPEDYVPPWQPQFGPAPDVAEAARAVAANDPPRELVRAYHWMAVVPDQVVADDWSGPLSVIAAAYGEPSRESLEHRPRVEIATGRSPKFR